jgi:hypothetical protein
VGMGGRSSVDGNLRMEGGKWGVGELVSHFTRTSTVADVVVCRTLCVFLPGSKLCLSGEC